MAVKKTKIKKADYSWLLKSIIPAVIFLVLFLGFLWFYFLSEKTEIYSSFIVSDKTGFDLNKSALTFGAVKPGDSASREIMLNNNKGYPVKISIMSKGEIGSFLIVSENDFIIEPHGSRKIGFSVYVPEGTEHKKYEGIINIIPRRV